MRSVIVIIQLACIANELVVNESKDVKGFMDELVDNLVVKAANQLPGLALKARPGASTRSAILTGTALAVQQHNHVASSIAALDHDVTFCPKHALRKDVKESSAAAVPCMLARRTGILGAIGAAIMPSFQGAAEAAIIRDCIGLRVLGLRIAITGASSGIGLEAARLLYTCGADVIVLNRNAVRVQESVNAIMRSSASSESAGKITGLVCDLTNLSSVNAAADALANANAPIDVLCLNAGLQFTGETEPRITANGFEETLQTNHLGHFLLASRLLPTLARARQQRLASGVDVPSRIVVTASEVHDPLSPGGKVDKVASLGALEGLLRPNRPGAGMVDGGLFDGNKMYKDTKLLNILFTYELTRRLGAVGVTPADITVNSFSPGLITQTGLFRYGNQLPIALFDFAARNIFRVTETVEGGGALLANMATNPEYFAGSGGYWSNELAGFGGHDFKSVPTSAESQEVDKAARAYDISARLVGIDADATIKATVAELRSKSSL